MQMNRVTIFNKIQSLEEEIKVYEAKCYQFSMEKDEQSHKKAFEALSNLRNEKDEYVQKLQQLVNGKEY